MMGREFISGTPEGLLYPRNLTEIAVEEGSRAVIVDASPEPLCSVRVGRGASLIHYRFCDAVDAAVDAVVEAEGKYEAFTVQTSGGNVGMTVSLAGENASCRSDAVYVSCGDAKGGFVSKIVHNADATFSSQLIKGALSGTAQETFDGLILIPSGHKGIDGSQQHRALLLSDRAQVLAIPRLEIYSDDVKCAHGSAIGDLDARQLYYLQTRGVEAGEAQKILVGAFLNEVTDGIPDETVRDEFVRRIESALPF